MMTRHQVHDAKRADEGAYAMDCSASVRCRTERRAELCDCHLRLRLNARMERVADSDTMMMRVDALGGETA